MRIPTEWYVPIVGRMFASALWVLFRTLRLQVETTSQANPYASHGAQRYLFSVWHDSAVIAAFGGPHVRTVALTSRHRDGSFVATVADCAGVKAVRGSTGVTGGRALRELLRVAEEKDIVMTPDGPRGPQRRISRGIVFLASRSGSAIVPTAFTCERSWNIPGSWTHLKIPCPFTRVVLLAGEPIHVPPDINDETIDEYVEHVQGAMDQLDDRAHRLIGHALARHEQKGIPCRSEK